jgi:hypothetical protein
MWNVAVGLFWVAVFIGLYVWACPLPELKKPAGDAVKEPDRPSAQPPEFN